MGVVYLDRGRDRFSRRYACTKNADNTIDESAVDLFGSQLDGLYNKKQFRGVDIKMLDTNKKEE
jgi:hypothetical protein